MTDKPKRPRDANQLAKFIVDVATGDPDPEVMKGKPSDREPEQRHAGRCLLWPGQSHHQRKGEDQDNDDPIASLATPNTGGIINHTNEPEPPKLKPL